MEKNPIIEIGVGEAIKKYWGKYKSKRILPSPFLDWKALQYGRVYAGKTLETSEGRGSL